jgi:hypothetical protein
MHLRFFDAGSHLRMAGASSCLPCRFGETEFHTIPCFMRRIYQQCLTMTKPSCIVRIPAANTPTCLPPIESTISTTVQVCVCIDRVGIIISTEQLESPIHRVASPHRPSVTCRPAGLQRRISRQPSHSVPVRRPPPRLSPAIITDLGCF